MPRSKASGGARGRGQLEADVLGCLAANGQPMTPGEIRDVLGDLAYTTVMTTLTRLYEKGALERQPSGRAYAYSLVGDAEVAQLNMRAHRMLKLLDSETDRAGVLARFVAELDPADERLLAELLARQESGEQP